MSHAPPRQPLVAIVGATGTGKSQVRSYSHTKAHIEAKTLQLAVNLAVRFDGEIINGDALQLYSGLPIATNKIPVEERKGIKHHLLGRIGLDEDTWTVGKFVEEASNTIDEIRSRGKLPILVGGTHYYTQALLFKDSLLAVDEAWTTKDEQENRWPILAASGEEMYEELRKIDPVMAARWHPKDARKVRRSLEIWLQTGKRASDVYANQRHNGSSEEESTEVEILDDRPSPNGLKAIHDLNATFDSPLRYPTLILWVYSDLTTLRERLNVRVDEMVSNGLLQEVESMEAFRRGQIEAGVTIDISRGIWVAIGYKEFFEYFKALRQDLGEAQLQRMKYQCTEQTKIATRQYAKSQMRWNRTKLLRSMHRAKSARHMFLLDGTDLATWQEQVEDVAGHLVEEFVAGRSLPRPLEISEVAERVLDPDDVKPAVIVTQSCELCDVTVTTARDWEWHLKSRKHKALLRRQRNPGRQVVSRVSGRNA